MSEYRNITEREIDELGQIQKQQISDYNVPIHPTSDFNTILNMIDSVDKGFSVSESIYSLDDPRTTLHIDKEEVVSKEDGVGESVVVFKLAEDSMAHEIIMGYDNDGNKIGDIDALKSFVEDNYKEGYVDGRDYNARISNLDGLGFELNENGRIPENYRNAWEERINNSEREDIRISFPKTREFLQEQGSAIVPTVKGLSPQQVSEIAHGFIPFELRDGAPGDGIKITKDFSMNMREDYNPMFAKLLGHDTFKYDTSETGNVKVITLSKEDIEVAGKYIDQYQNPKFATENIESIKVYIEKGDAGPVSNGERYTVNNLLTIETKLKGDETNYRYNALTDDAGNCWCCDVCPRENEWSAPFEIVMDHADDTHSYFEFADQIKDRFETQEQKEEFIARFDPDKIEAVKNYVMDKEVRIFSDHIPSVRGELVRIDKAEEKITNIFTRAEICKEYQVSKLVPVADKLRSLGRDVSSSSSSLFNMETHGVSKDSKEYKDELQKRDDLWNEVKDTYKEYEVMRSDLKIDDLISLSTVAASTYEKIKIEDFKQTQNLYETTGKDPHVDKTTRNSFIDSVYQGRPATTAERAKMLSEVVHFQSDRIPDDATVTVLNGQLPIPEDLSFLDDISQEIIDVYNDKQDSDFEKVHLGEDGMIYNAFAIYMQPEGMISISEDTPSPEATELIINREQPLRIDGREFAFEYDRVLPDSVRPVLTRSGMYEPTSSWCLTQYKYDGENKVESIEKRFCDEGVLQGLDKTRVRWESNLGASKDLREELSSVFKTSERSEKEAELEVLSKHINDPVNGKDMESEIKDVEKRIDQEKSDKLENLTNGFISIDDEHVPKMDDVTEEKKNYISNGNLDRNSDKLDRIMRDTGMNPRGSVNAEKDVDVSLSKKTELREEARAEANGDVDKEEKIYNEKLADTKAALNEIKLDISHLSEKIDEFKNRPRVGSNTFYQMAKGAFDSKVNEYVKAGGSVGKEEYCTKGVTKFELFNSNLDIYRTNLRDTIMTETATGNSRHPIPDIFTRETKDGSMKAISVDSKFISFMKPYIAVTSPTMVLSYLVGKLQANEKIDSAPGVLKEEVRETAKETVADAVVSPVVANDTSDVKEVDKDVVTQVEKTVTSSEENNVVNNEMDETSDFSPSVDYDDYYSEIPLFTFERTEKTDEETANNFAKEQYDDPGYSNYVDSLIGSNEDYEKELDQFKMSEDDYAKNQKVEYENSNEKVDVQDKEKEPVSVNETLNISKDDKKEDPDEKTIAAMAVETEMEKSKAQEPAKPDLEKTGDESKQNTLDFKETEEKEDLQTKTVAIEEQEDADLEISQAEKVDLQDAEVDLESMDSAFTLMENEEATETMTAAMEPIDNDETLDNTTAQETDDYNEAVSDILYNGTGAEDVMDKIVDEMANNDPEEVSHSVLDAIVDFFKGGIQEEDDNDTRVERAGDIMTEMCQMMSDGGNTDIYESMMSYLSDSGMDESTLSSLDDKFSSSLLDSAVEVNDESQFNDITITEDGIFDSDMGGVPEVDVNAMSSGIEDIIKEQDVEIPNPADNVDTSADLVTKNEPDSATREQHNDTDTSQPDTEQDVEASRRATNATTDTNNDYDTYKPNDFDNSNNYSDDSKDNQQELFDMQHNDVTTDDVDSSYNDVDGGAED